MITLSAMFPGYNHFNPVEVGAVIVLVIGALIVGIKLKMSMPMVILKIGIGVYFIILATMFVKASSLGINYMLSGAPYGLITFLVLFVGSLSFLVSDVLIGVILFAGKKKNYPLKIVNIVTYFVAQVLLASSILFIKG
jgi:hypothetical protein